MAKVWVTRSEPGASLLANSLRDHGCAVLLAPVIEISNYSSPRIEPGLGKNSSPEAVMVLSGHAARAYISSEFLANGMNSLHIAVGAQTGAVLESAGLTVAYPDQATSEGILAMPVVLELSRNSSVWLMAGQGGRKVLGEKLLAQQCAVHKFEFYKRVELQLKSLEPTDICVVVLASAQGARYAGEQWFEAKGSAGVCVVVPSARVAKIALEIGFNNVHNTDSTDPAMVTQWVRTYLSSTKSE
ncbi:MAG: uroporphyrinogen-III synthase [Gammaproteobacteria bacterium]|nr:uroporphyrinogen-III synthase [Gammaproteobacteria bacterium]